LIGSLVGGLSPKSAAVLVPTITPELAFTPTPEAVKADVSVTTQSVAQPTTEPTSLSVQSGKAIIIAETLNVCAGPSKNYPVIGKLKKGTVVEVTGMSADQQFYRIRWTDEKGQTCKGWIAANSEYVDADDAAKQAAVVPSAESPATSTPMLKSPAAPVPTEAFLPTPVSLQQTLITGVPRHPQSFNLSCESRSAVDLAAFWGVSIEEASFVAALPRSDNPHKGFVGDVNAPRGSLPAVGYGVYAEPVAATLQHLGVNAQARYQLGIEALQAELDNGRPVIIWATSGMKDHPVQDWVSADGAISRVVPHEHTFIAIGYDAQGVYLIDALDAAVKYYDYTTFDPVWRKFDQMAVVAYGPLAIPTPTNALKPTKTSAPTDTPAPVSIDPAAPVSIHIPKSA
jgi:uncharacterized protein YvpB/uncharacterized protein YraI